MMAYDHQWYLRLLVTRDIRDGRRVDPHQDPVLYGRDRINEVLWDDCLSRPRKARPDLPIVILVGPPGIGKTSILDHLAANCVRHAAQPFAPVVDLRRPDTPRRGWQIIGGLAYQLSAQNWAQFGRLAFPRTTLGRIVVQANVTLDGPETTQQAIEKLLMDATQLDGIAEDVAQLVGQIPRLLGLPDLTALGRVGARVVRSRVITRLRFRVGMAFYGEVLRHRANNGFPALVELSRLGRETNKDSRATLDRVLCQAFLADLAENFTHGFRPRNCLILLDNIDTEVGQDVVAALIAAKSATAGQGDPLLVVATSRALDPVTRISAFGGIAAEHRSLWAEMPADTAATSAGTDSWLYPVRLTDLDPKPWRASRTPDFPTRRRHWLRSYGA